MDGRIRSVNRVCCSRDASQDSAKGSKTMQNELDGYRPCSCFEEAQCHYCSAPEVVYTYQYPMRDAPSNLHLACVDCFEREVKWLLYRGDAQEV